MERLSAARRALAAFGGWMNVCAGWLTIACAILITGDIVGRELGFAIPGSMELSTYCMAITISWGLARALSVGQHVRIDVLVNHAPPRLRQYLHALALLAMLAWTTLLAYGAVTLVQESIDFGAADRSPLAVPLVLPQGAWAFGIVFFLVFVALLLAEVACAIALGQPERVERLLAPRSLEDEAKEAIEAVGGARSASP